MPRNRPVVATLSLSEVDVEMLRYVLGQAGTSEMNNLWSSAARRLLRRLESGDPDPNVLRVLDVSTAHLSQGDREALENGGLVNQTMTGHYGGLAWTPGFETPAAICAGDQPDSECCPPGVNEPLWAVLRLARERGCAYVLFDRDARHVPGLEVFEAGD